MLPTEIPGEQSRCRVDMLPIIQEQMYLPYTNRLPTSARSLRVVIPCNDSPQFQLEMEIGPDIHAGHFHCRQQPLLSLHSCISGRRSASSARNNDHLIDHTTHNVSVSIA